MASPLPPDTLNDIGVLKRREIEARIIAPLIEAFGAEFGREGVLEMEGAPRCDFRYGLEPSARAEEAPASRS